MRRLGPLAELPALARLCLPRAALAREGVDVLEPLCARRRLHLVGRFFSWGARGKLDEPRLRLEPNDAALAALLGPTALLVAVS